MVGLTVGGKALAADLAVPNNVTNSLHPTGKVVGVLEKFTWNGGAGDPLKFQFWISKRNATQLKAAQQTTLTTTTVDALDWWIGNYDSETKKWFEQAYPTTTSGITGILAGGKENPGLDVDLNPVAVKDGIDVMVYKVTLTVAPVANKGYSLEFASSAGKTQTQTWGLKVGTLATTLPK
jgi:hypothetical protein